MTKDAQTGDKIYVALPPGYLLPSLELSRQDWEVVEAGEGKGLLERVSEDFIVQAAHVGLIEA